MYVKYEEIFDILALFMPVFLRKSIRKTGHQLKMNQNLNYIKNNQKKVIERLKEKVKRGEKLNVAFYVYSKTRWKNQSIYDLMDKSKNFCPYVFVTKNIAPKTNFNYKDKKEVQSVYEFFKNKNMRVKYAYDTEKDSWIPFENMNPKPDIIYYSHPWHVHKTQGPVMASKYALTYYSEYSVPASLASAEYALNFHLYLYKQYVLNETIREYFASNMKNNGSNLKVAGHPVLDYFYLNKNSKFEDKKYIIYAPHWSIDESTTLKWGTFLEFGEFILEYAKMHPEFNWLFKPHPSLKDYLKLKKFWSEEKIQKYWDDWKKVGTIYESGDYLDLFMESDAMITDCGSFRSEYFMTQKPQIILKSENSTGFNPNVTKINRTSYIVEKKEELEIILNEVLVKKNDYKKDIRRKLYEQEGYGNTYCARNVIEDIEETLEIYD